MNDDLPVSGPGLRKAKRWMRKPSKAELEARRKAAAERKAKKAAEAVEEINAELKPARYCICGGKLGLVDVSKEYYAIVCEDISCSKWRQPQGYLERENGPKAVATKKQVKIDAQLAGVVEQEEKHGGKIATGKKNRKAGKKS